MEKSNRLIIWGQKDGGTGEGKFSCWGLNKVRYQVKTENDYNLNGSHGI